MLKKSALQNHFDTQVADYTSLKSQTKEKIYTQLKEMGIHYHFKTVPRLNQLTAFFIAILEDSFLFYYDTGTGKTKSVLDIIAYKKQQKQIKKALILVAGPSAILDISSQVSTHTDLLVKPLSGASDKKWEQLLDSHEDIIVLNYQSLISMVCSLIKVKKGKKREYVADPEKLLKFRSFFDLIVFDEIFMLQNHRSITYKVCEVISRGVLYKYGLTGTPMGKTQEALWAQFYLMDGGYTLGKNITAFRQHFFTVKKNYWGGYVHKFIKNKEKELKNRLQNKSLTYTIKDLGEELPKQNYQQIFLELDKEPAKMYNDILSHTANEFLNGAEIQHSYAKLRQICSGFVQFVPEESEEKNIYVFPKNQKLDTLIEYLEKIPVGCKSLIFYEFIESGKIIEKALKKQKIAYLRLNANVKKFADSKKIKVMLLQNRAGATSLNLQAANYVFFYESILCPALRHQQEARVYRIGQEKPVFYYDFLTQNTVEENIKESLKEGKELSASLFFRNRLKV